MDNIGVVAVSGIMALGPESVATIYRNGLATLSGICTFKHQNTISKHERAAIGSLKSLVAAQIDYNNNASLQPIGCQLWIRAAYDPWNGTLQGF